MNRILPTHNPLFLATAVGLFVLLSTVGIVHAAAYYNKGEGPNYPFAMSPDWGQWYWWNNNPTSAQVTWEKHNWWAASSVQALNSSPAQFHFEVEAYNPGTGGSCDRLHVYQIEAHNIPLRAPPEIRNGCGASSTLEEVRMYIRKSGIAANTWYAHYERYQKRYNATNTDEVNYSFGPTGLGIEDWLAKLGYFANYNMRCTNPYGLVNTSIPGC